MSEGTEQRLGSALAVISAACELLDSPLGGVEDLMPLLVARLKRHDEDIAAAQRTIDRFSRQTITARAECAAAESGWKQAATQAARLDIERAGLIADVMDLEAKRGPRVKFLVETSADGTPMLIGIKAGRPGAFIEELRDLDHSVEALRRLGFEVSVANEVYEAETQRGAGA